MSKLYYDFFAGGGMAGIGLGPTWKCLFANDIDEKKAESYRANHGGGSELLVRDIASVLASEVPGEADLAWASFPCQDLSLAGNGRGLAGQRSGAFRPFWELVSNLTDEGRGPKIVSLENVYGTISSNEGRDFATLVEAFVDLGYRVGALIIDAVHFVPQSRPRFVLVAVRKDILISSHLIGSNSNPLWHPKSLCTAQAKLSKHSKENWVWWNLQNPPVRNSNLSSLIEEEPTGIQWNSQEQTNKLLSLMTDINLDKVKQAIQTGEKTVGTIYKRTRLEADGNRRQRAEVRFDEVAGCLRTPGGGSSRQTIMLVEGKKIRTRLLSTREAARLMGLPDDYLLPTSYNQAYKLTGDGVAVPVVRFLSDNLFEPLLSRKRVSLAA